MENKGNEAIKLKTRVSNLESLFQYSVIRNIDLVSDCGDLYFWYTKDQSYEWIKPAPSTIINYTPSEKDFILSESCEYTITESYEKYDLNQSKLFEMDLKNFLFLHLWLNEIDFTYVNIGANVGTTTVPAAKFFQKYQRENKIISFEPGIVYDLLTFTPYPYWRCSLIGEDMNSFKKFAQQVKEFSRGWIDVLALRRNLPNLNLLTTRLTNNMKNNWFTKDN